MQALTLKNISKKYFLEDRKPILLKSLLFPPKKQIVWALRKISLNLSRGESLGIIGENGSGKSTLLKIIAGITFPSSGKITKIGKVASIIELGAGFHPDFTGKENIYLNGALAGIAKKDLDQKFPEIVNFSELNDFINQPLRTYSSGMIVRLAFSLAISFEPDILLIDEVLAVGDESFQKKCIEKILELKKTKTILFVSHNLSHVYHVCDKCLFLEKGRAVLIGQTSKVIALYTKKAMKTKYFLTDKKARWGNGDAVITQVKLSNESGQASDAFFEGEKMLIKIYVKFVKNVINPVIGITIKDRYFKDIFITNTLWKGIKTGNFSKGDLIETHLNFEETFPEGEYFISPAVASENLKIFFDWRDNFAHFTVQRKSIKGSLTPKHNIKIQKL